MSSFLNKTTASLVKDSQISVNQLTVSELDYLLRLLKTVTLTGDQVEVFYNLVVKIQNQYIEMQSR